MIALPRLRRRALFVHHETFSAARAESNERALFAERKPPLGVVDI